MNAALSQELPLRVDVPPKTLTVDGMLKQLVAGSFMLTDDTGKVLENRQWTADAPVPMTEADIVAAVRATPLTAEQADTLWDFFANDDNAALRTLSIISSLVAQSSLPRARDALWSELSSVMNEIGERGAKRERSLLGFFEQHRNHLRPLYSEIRETESSGDEMVKLMLASRVFGADLDESLEWMTQTNPAPLARRMELDRGRGKPVAWEATAFKGMVRWKDARLVPAAPKAPQTLSELDAVGESFITIFNCLHDMEPKYRETIVRGIGPVGVFNAAVGGEIELYRLGTSSYRDHLHAIIMRGIKEAGSFEAFLARASHARLGPDAAHAMGRRGMIYLRVVSSFGLLDDILDKVRDLDRFVQDAIASLGDISSFEGNSSVVMDLLTTRSDTPATFEFKRTILDRLYQSYRADAGQPLRQIYGSMLSVYQTVTGDRRDRAVDKEFPLDEALFLVPFGRLFSRDVSDHRLVHRMFMRMDQDTDAVTTYNGFRALMSSRGARVQSGRYFDIFRISANGRTVEIYANHPNALGIRKGIAGIAEALVGKRVETVIGRGHSSIIAPLQVNAKQVLGDRTKQVAAVLVGTCGGDASVRDLISTFGYRPFFATRSTGRHLINNAIIDVYIASLLSLAPNNRLILEEVLSKATAPFMRRGGDSELRDDASFYRLSMTTVLSAFLFQTQIRRHLEPAPTVAQ